MLRNHDSTLQITRLSGEAISQLSPSFQLLPHTSHADGEYRLRRYSVVRYINDKVVATDKNEFVQSEEINHFQGDIIRQFESLLDATLTSDGMREMCRLFVESNDLPNGQEIEIHQIRISAIFDETQVAPEGVHQDGFDHIALIGIGRHNIVGGEIMLYSDSHEAPFFCKVLENGEVALLADKHLWHNACPIRTVDNAQGGHMDLFVLTAKEGIDELHS
ncbi:2OG-Fe dioxygenase family protein [Vibrio kasasachensis]|uniref:2OG-Fe dioxygenase family protein n=1 Tax=Vibrio kasasachensis TaxID=2910248 RepID=UPI003D099640